MQTCIVCLNVLCCHPVNYSLLVPVNVAYVCDLCMAHYYHYHHLNYYHYFVKITELICCHWWCANCTEM